MRFAAIGDNCVDIYKNLGLVCPGGGSVNFAVQSARAGVSAAYLGAFGKDAYGKLIVTSLEEENIDTTHVQWLAGNTATAFVELRGYERVFIGSNHGVRSEFEMNQSVQDYLGNFDHIHTTLDGNVDGFISDWKKRGLNLSYDFSHRYKPEQLELLPYLSVAFFSGQKYTMQEGYDFLVTTPRLGASLAVMTFGENGSVAFDGNKFYVQPKTTPAIVVDTLGAGDSFQAGFMVAYMQGKPIEISLLAGAELAKRTIGEIGGFGHMKKLNQVDTQ